MNIVEADQFSTAHEIPLMAAGRMHGPLFRRLRGQAVRV